MDLWFEEIIENSVRFGLRVKNHLFSEQSDFQKVDVFETDRFGRMMVIDGCVMVTDRDEFVYHELISHVPLLLHSNPRRVLVIGGGDGGTVREVLKHKCVEEVVLCEIDGLVVSAAKEFFPAISAGLSDPRVSVKIQDGIKFVQDSDPGAFDLIVVDSTDPIGPGVGLFTKGFYSNVARIVGPEGLVVCQSESPWYGKDVLGRIFDNLSAGFKYKAPYLGAIPTYPLGTWSFTLGSQKPLDSRTFDMERFQQFSHSLSYLNEGMLRSTFSVPQFYAQKLGL